MLRAANPLYGAVFIQEYGWHAVMVLGAVVLRMTGDEALYTEIGRSGGTPVRVAW